MPGRCGSRFGREMAGLVVQRIVADEDSLCDIIERVPALIDVCPEIAELDINPVKGLAKGAWAVDVRIRVERERPQRRWRRVEY